MNSFYLLYVDPGTGSLAAQVIIAGIAAGIIFFRDSFKRVFYWNKKRKGKNEENA